MREPPDYFAREMTLVDQIHPCVESFSCGSEEWAYEVAEALRGGEVLAEQRLREGNETVLVFVDSMQTKLAGFIQIGVGEWGLPLPEGTRKVPGLIISFLGVNTIFQRRGYADAMLELAINRALDKSLDAVFLFVDERNKAAIAKYKQWDFEFTGKTFRDAGKNYKMMAFSLLHSP